MRCLTLANALASRGWFPVFSSNPDSLNLIPALGRYRSTTCNTADGIANALGDQFDLVVFDGYSFSADYERDFRRISKRILVIDDLADRPHDCDFLVDQTLGRDPEDYHPFVPAHARIMAGSAFAIIRPEFPAIRQQSLARRRRNRFSTQRILVSFGASDPRALGAGVVTEVCSLLPNVEIDFIVDPQTFKNAEKLLLASSVQGRLKIHFQSDRIADLMCAADLAIGACGTTSWERCVVGLPSVVVVTAENQRLIADRLASAGAAEVVGDWRGVTVSMIAQSAIALARDSTRMGAMSDRASNLIDGRGVKRIVEDLA